jgi:hypothetical protein
MIFLIRTKCGILNYRYMLRICIFQHVIDQNKLRLQVAWMLFLEVLGIRFQVLEIKAHGMKSILSRFMSAWYSCCQ